MFIRYMCMYRTWSNEHLAVSARPRGCTWTKTIYGEGSLYYSIILDDALRDVRVTRRCTLHSRGNQTRI